MRIALLSFGPFIGLVCLSVALHFWMCRKELRAMDTFCAADEKLQKWRVDHPGKKAQDFNEGAYLYSQREQALQEVRHFRPDFLRSSVNTA